MSAVRIRAVIVEGPADDDTLELIRDALAAPGLAVVFARPSIEEIVNRVSHDMGVTMAEIFAAGTDMRGGRARNAICWLAFRATQHASGAIGKALGGRKGGTVLNAIARADGLRERDPAFRALTDRLLEHFTGERQ